MWGKWEKRDAHTHTDTHRQTQRDVRSRCSFFNTRTLARTQATATCLPQAGGEKKKLMEFHANSRSVSFPSSGRPRQTEHVTTPALPSASSFSWQHRLIAEVIRLGKAVLKIKVSHVSQYFRLDGYEAFEGDIHGGRQSAALSSARLSLLLLLQGREALKRNFISQRMFCSGSLEKQRGQGSKSPLFLRGSFEARMCKSRGKGFWSYPTATRLQGERRFTSSMIYILFYFFLVAPVCVCGLCGFCLYMSICQCVHLSCETHSIDKMYFYPLTAPGVLAWCAQIKNCYIRPEKTPRCLQQQMTR